MSLTPNLIEMYRRTGADVPFGSPLASHGTEMEGWFWRVSDEARGRALIALCSVNRHPAGDWSTPAVGVPPGGVVRAAARSGRRGAGMPAPRCAKSSTAPGGCARGAWPATSPSSTKSSRPGKPARPWLAG